MKQTFIIIALSNLIIASGFAQESVYRYDDATQLWRTSGNAAGLSIDAGSKLDSASYNRGFAQFTFQHQDGDYHRVQEGGSSNLLQFHTERYQTIGKYLVGYGRFTFDMDHTKDRAWCDVMRPYNANPYISGSSVKGTYETQDFDFTGMLSTVPLVKGEDPNDGLRLGVKFDYKVGDLSRLRDPRSRSELLDYKLAPAITYTMGRHTLGLDGIYERRKEKIPNMQTVQNDPNLYYYFMTGMENASGSVGSYKGFDREWVDHRFGAALSYAYNGEQQHSLLILGIERGVEYVYGQYKYEPGRFTSFRYAFDLRNRFYEGNVIHQLDLLLNYEEAFGDEYLQRLYQEKNSTTGITSYSYNTLIRYDKRYQVNVLNADMRYRAHFVSEGKEQGYAGLHLTLQDVKNKHLLPTSSLTYGSMLVMAEGGWNVCKQLTVDLSAGGNIAEKTDLILADPTSDLAQQVLLPDMEYYNANYWRGHLQLTYQFPLKLRLGRSQAKQSLWYVRAFGDYLHTNNNLKSRVAGISIGLFN